MMTLKHIDMKFHFELYQPCNMLTFWLHWKMELEEDVLCSQATTPSAVLLELLSFVNFMITIYLELTPQPCNSLT